MSTDRITRVLTAFVDGELSPRERRAVQRHLKKSQEARALLRALQQDSELIRSLPRVGVDESFPETVLAALDGMEISAEPVLATQVSPRPFAAYAGLAAAAVILIAVASASYIHFADRWSNNDPEVAEIPQAAEPEEREIVPVPTTKTTPKKTPPKRNPKRAEPTVVAKGPATPSTTPQVQPTQPEVKPIGTGVGEQLAGPIPSMEGFQIVNPRFAVVMNLHDLRQNMERDNLRKEMSKDSATRIELFANGNGQAWQHLQEALKAKGVQLHVDEIARGRLGNKKLTTDFILYCDHLTVAEWIEILQQLARKDAQAEAKKAGDGQFGKLIALPLTASDLGEMAKLMATDAKKLTPPPVGQGGKGVSDPQLSKQALVLSYNPVRPKPQTSKEIKSFLEARKLSRPGAVQVVLVLRGSNG